MSEWIRASEQKPPQGERVLLKISYEDCPVVGYWGAGEWEACTVNHRVDCGTWCQGGMVERAFESEDVSHWKAIGEVPDNDPT